MTDTKQTHFDAIVIGAGFAGLYMLHKLRNELGLTVRLFDRAGGIGGTWYWNRYPGAMSDVDSYIYRYSFDKELLQEWNWTTRYSPQREILAYLQTVVDRHDLARDIQLDTSIEAAVFDESRDRWTVSADTGETFTSRYLVTALGPLSSRNFPDIKGRDTFQGRMVHTGAWPDDLDIEGKRVGVIGTGSTGTQFVCAASKLAGHLTVFQRSAQYCVLRARTGQRGVRGRVPGQLRQDLGAGARVPGRMRIRGERHPRDERVRGGTPPHLPGELGQGQRLPLHVRHLLRHRHRPGGQRGRLRVHQVEDQGDRQGSGDGAQAHPDPAYAKRPICNPDYYESYNRDNVTLVSIKENPIREMTPKGVVTEDGVEHELDVLVFATGYDAVDGSYRQIDIRGRGGRTIQEHWDDGPTSYLASPRTGSRTSSWCSARTAPSATCRPASRPRSSGSLT